MLADEPATPPPHARRRWTSPRWALPRVGIAVVPIVVALVLLLAGTFSGPDDSGTEPAAADVTRAAIRALTQSPGTIFVENQTYVSGPSVHGHPYTLDEVLETPTGPGTQNKLTTTDDPTAIAPNEHPAASGWSYVGGVQQFYSPTTHTIYVSSIWGPYLHPGRRPGTFVYRYAKGGPAFAPRPVTVTAGQARALRDGTGVLSTTGPTSGFRFRRAPRAPSDAETFRQELAHHILRFVGRTTVRGRPALELTGTTNGLKSDESRIYLDPTTHLPIAEVDHPGTAREQVIHWSVRRLPITRTTRRLLSLRALHPAARIDRDHGDFLRAADGTSFYP